METLEVRQSVKFKNILLATDFSDASKKAVPYATAIARRCGSKIYLVHVISGEARTPVAVEPLPVELNYGRNDAELEMKTFLLSNPLGDVPNEVALEEGPIWDVLSSLIERNEIDVLVLGTHGRGGLKKVLFGSVAEELFRLASCPVLTVGPTVSSKPTGAGELSRILFATDFGPASLSALHCAVSLATENKARLILLHVVPPVPAVDLGPYWYVDADIVEPQKTAKARSKERLRHLIAPEVNLPSDPELLVDFDFVPDAIVKRAADSHADLIVMGVNQAASARASAHLPWATAHEVVCRAPCPVLTVRS